MDKTPVKLPVPLNPGRQRVQSLSLWLKHPLDSAKLAIDHMFARLPIYVHKALLAGESSVVLALSVAGAAFVVSGHIDYSVAKSQNCLQTPIVLPRLMKLTGGGDFNLQLSGERKLFGYPLLATQTCAVPTAPPAQVRQELRLRPSYLPFISKTISVQAPNAPNVELGRPADMPISTTGALVFHLSSADFFYDYRLSANGQATTCAELDAALLCNLDRLAVKQGERYDFKLERLFAGAPAGGVYEATHKTVEPVKISLASIKSGQVVQDVPVSLTVTASKPLIAAVEVDLYLLAAGKEELVPTRFALNEKRLTLTFEQPLKRSADFRLRVSGLTASDGGYLLKPYELKFRTSGGPKVSSVNIGGYGVDTAQTITLTLDAEPKAGQNLRQYFRLSGSGFDYNISSAGRNISFTPAGSWPRCARFSLALSDGLKNKFGVSGGSAWTTSSRTLCRSTFSIGTSVQGRAILAHRFGSGSERVILVGGTHGDEPSSVYTLNSLVDNLEAQYDSIPGNKTVIVVPSINPDGVAQGRRTNARNVDLNRNFPANNWKEDVVMPGGSLNEGGGGSAPLSEPESSAISSFVLSQSPKLVLTYHAVGSMVIANESGNSRSLATTYADSTGYWSLGNSEVGGIFTHDTTGAFEDWLHDKHGLPALLIELSSYGGNHFWSHQSAMWAMIKS
jgi:protein MpaA